MALPTYTDLKTYLRIETTAEDALLVQLVARAQAEVESSVGKSLTTESVVWIDDAISHKMYGPPCSLILKYVPVQASGLTVTDIDGVAVDAATYTLRQDRQQIIGKSGVSFANGPYSIALTAGFGTDPNYATRWLPRITQLILDYAAFLYQQRNIGASKESASGTTIDYGPIDDCTGLPFRIARGLAKLRGIVIPS